jgi:hypothetical protein
MEKLVLENLKAAISENRLVTQVPEQQQEQQKSELANGGP